MTKIRVSFSCRKFMVSAAMVGVLFTMQVDARASAIALQGLAKTTSGPDLVDATHTTLTMPSPVGAGLICLAHLALSGNNYLTMPAGWTRIREDINGPYYSTQGLYWHLT